MDITEKLTKAKVILILNQPFYASLVLQSDILPDNTIETAQTDGTMIAYNPAFFDTLTTDEVAGVLAHEVMHIAHMHHLRMNDREPGRWNYACDYAINPLLIKSGLKLPEGCLLDDQYINMSAEQIYALLPPMPPGERPKPGMGDVCTPPSGEDPREVADQIKKAVAQAILDQRLKGKVPDYLERLVQDILRPKIDWRAALSRYLAEISRNDYTWRRPSPRYIFQGLFLPLLESMTTGKLILIVDTSGSIQAELINQFAGEVRDIAAQFSISLQVLYVDDAFQSIQDFEAGEPIELKPCGGGCTDFRPGFDYIHEQDLQPRAVVYLTDGACHLFPEEPIYPVIWAQFGYYPFEPPFGELIKVDQAS